MIAGSTEHDFLHIGINAATADIRERAGRRRAIKLLKVGVEVMTIDTTNRLVLLTPAKCGRFSIKAFVLDPSLSRKEQHGVPQKITRGDLKRIAGVCAGSARPQTLKSPAIVDRRCVTMGRSRLIAKSVHSPKSVHRPL